MFAVYLGSVGVEDVNWARSWPGGEKHMSVVCMEGVCDCSVALSFKDISVKCNNLYSCAMSDRM